MLGFVILGVLAAFGALCMLWALFGLLLPGARGGALVCLCKAGNEEAILRRYFWLQAMGLLRCPLVLLGSSFSEARQQMITEKNPNVKFYAPAEFAAGLQKEREELG